MEIVLTKVLLWTLIKWSGIPILILFLIGVSGVFPDNDWKPVRATMALFSGMLLLVWIATFVIRGLIL